jgi:hypothetical protein
MREGLYFSLLNMCDGFAHIGDGCLMDGAVDFGELIFKRGNQCYELANFG